MILAYRINQHPTACAMCFCFNFCFCFHPLLPKLPSNLPGIKMECSPSPLHSFADCRQHVETSLLSPCSLRSTIEASISPVPDPNLEHRQISIASKSQSVFRHFHRCDRKGERHSQAAVRNKSLRQNLCEIEASGQRGSLFYWGNSPSPRATFSFSAARNPVRNSRHYPRQNLLLRKATL